MLYMCIYICVCVYVYVTHTHTWVAATWWSQDSAPFIVYIQYVIHVYVCICICVYVYVYVCITKYTHMRGENAVSCQDSAPVVGYVIHVYMYMYTTKHAHLRVINVYMYMYISIPSNTHTCVAKMLWAIKTPRQPLCMSYMYKYVYVHVNKCTCTKHTPISSFTKHHYVCGCIIHHNFWDPSILNIMNSKFWGQKPDGPISYSCMIWCLTLVSEACDIGCHKWEFLWEPMM